MFNKETIATSTETPRSIASWEEKPSNSTVVFTDINKENSKYNEATGTTTTTPYVIHDTEKSNLSLSDIISIAHYE